MSIGPLVFLQSLLAVLNQTASYGLKWFGLRLQEGKELSNGVWFVQELTELKETSPQARSSVTTEA